MRRRQGAGCQRPAWACPGEGLVSAGSPLLDPHHHLDLCGTYGDPEGWRPVQYAELVIEHDQGEVEIVVYTRAILLFVTDSGSAADSHGMSRAYGTLGSCEPLTGGPPVLGWAVVSGPSRTGTYVRNGSAFPGTGVGGAGEKRIA